MSTLRSIPLAVAAALLLSACASDGGSPFGMSTASIDTKEQKQASRVDPACVALSSRIDTLRQEGVSDRAAQAAATGKSQTVQVKRASLAQLAELDKANAEFQAKCSTLGPRTAAVAPAPVATPAAAAAAPAAKVAKKATAQPAAAN